LAERPEFRNLVFHFDAVKTAPLLIVLFLLFALKINAQKTLVVEKVGSKIYYFNSGDRFKVRTWNPDMIHKAAIWSIRDTSVFIADLTCTEIGLHNMKVVYKPFPAMRIASYNLFAGSVFFFSVITVNHWINHEQPFDKLSWIVPCSALAAGVITISLSERPCRIGVHWKVKVMDFPYKVY
jgi:hypothetical protein